MEKRIISIDYGKKRIGLASASLELKVASPLSTLPTAKGHLETALSIIAYLQSEEIEVEMFVVGLPLSLSGHDSPMSLLVRQFAGILKDRSGKEVAFCDERLTSLEMDNLMKSNGIKRQKRKECVDALAATLLLQTYLETTGVEICLGR